MKSVSGWPMPRRGWNRLLKQKLTDRKHRLALLSGRLHGLSPLEKISKGFGFLTGEDGKGWNRQSR